MPTAIRHNQDSADYRRETGNPIEGAGVLAGGQVLVSLSEGTVTIPSRNSTDTVLVQSLGYKSQYISLKDVFKRKNTYTIRLSPEMTTLGKSSLPVNVPE